MNNFTIGMTYLSGHIPIAIIYAISVFWAKYKGELECSDFFIWLSIFYLFISSAAGYYIYKAYSDQLEDLRKGNGGTRYIIKPTQIKNLFTSDAMNYYILPLAAFAASDDLVKTSLILLVLTIIYGISFIRERMNLYTPFLILFGFVLFSCEIQDEDNSNKHEITILTKDPQKLVFGHSYKAVLQKLNNTTSLAIIQYDD